MYNQEIGSGGILSCKTYNETKLRILNYVRCYNSYKKYCHLLSYQSDNTCRFKPFQKLFSLIESTYMLIYTIFFGSLTPLDKTKIIISFINCVEDRLKHN